MASNVSRDEPALSEDRAKEEVRASSGKVGERQIGPPRVNELNEEATGRKADVHTDTVVRTPDDNSEIRARETGSKSSPAERSRLATELDKEDTKVKKNAQVELYTRGASSGREAAQAQIGAVAISSNAPASVPAGSLKETAAKQLDSNPSPDERARVISATNDSAAKKKALAGLKSNEQTVQAGAVAVSANAGPAVEMPTLSSIQSPDARARLLATAEEDSAVKKKKALEGLKMPYASHEEARTAMASSVSSERHSLKFSDQSDAQLEGNKAIEVSMGSSNSGDASIEDGAFGGTDQEEPPHIDIENLQSSSPGAVAISPTNSRGIRNWSQSGDSLGQTQSSLERFNGVALVSAKLVVDDNTPMEEAQPPMKEDEKVYEVAEQVTSGYFYCGKRKFDRRAIVLLLIAVIAIVVALSVSLSQRSRSTAGSTSATPDVYPNGTCGEGDRGNGLCRNGQCCSPFGFCGNSSDHCDIVGHPNGTCGGGNRGNGLCLDAQCCSPDGYCGASSEHCVCKNFQVDAVQINATIGPISTDKICGGYYVDRNTSSLSSCPGSTIKNVHPNYNVINLFAARAPDPPDGTLSFTPPYDDAAGFYADVQAERSSERKRSFALTVGGTNSGFEIPNRSFSERLLESIVTIYEDVGGLDGLDWDIFKDNEPSTEEMIWIGTKLKRSYPKFFISASVNPLQDRDKEFCRAAINASALDFCKPAFYGGPGLSAQSDVLRRMEGWVGSVGEEHLVVGLGVHPVLQYFQRPDEAEEIYSEIISTYPNIRGVFNWNIQNDIAQETGFAVDVCTVSNQQNTWK